MLVDINPTAFDLKFRLLGFPIRVNPFFWLVMALLGQWIVTDPDYGFFYLPLWVVCGFASILIHELGHAVAARWFGSPSSILLYGFGGLAMYESSPKAGWRRMVIALAGPAAGFALLAIVVASDAVADWSKNGRIFQALAEFLYVMNLFWSLLNLLPIWPLDGGKVCREVLYMAGARRPDATTYVISMVVAGAVLVLSLAAWSGRLPREVAEWIPFRPSLFTLLFFGFFIVQNYQLYQETNRRATWHD